MDSIEYDLFERILRGDQMETLNILTIGGLVPWHPQSGGGQIVSYELSKALAILGNRVDYLAIAPLKYQRKIEWGEFMYIKSGNLPSQILKALRLHHSQYDVIYVNAGNETAGYCLGHAIRATIAQTMKPKMLMGICAPSVHRFPRLFPELCWRFSCSSFDEILALSQYSKTAISSEYHVSRSRIRVTYGGVDDVFLSAGKKRALNDRLILLFCGRIDEPGGQKGIDILLKSVSMVSKRHDFLLEIVGTGSGLKHYEKEVIRLGIDSRVVFKGFVEHDRLPNEYTKADLFVFPSRNESFGLAICEAMAMGLPVVSTRVGAIPEIVEDRKTGILVDPDNPAALAIAIEEMLANPSMMEGMGLKGRDRVIQNFTWEHAAMRALS